MRLDGRGGATIGSADSRRVLNLSLADDTLLYVVMPDVGPLRTPFWVGTICRDLEVTGFWKVILSAPQYEKLILLFRSESSESPASSSSSSSGSGTIRGCTETCRVRERTTLLWDECKCHRDNRKKTTHSSIAATLSRGLAMLLTSHVSTYATRQ